MEFDTSKPIYTLNLRHFKNGLSLRLKPNRSDELKVTLAGFGITEDKWRLSFAQGHLEWLADHSLDAFISFRSKKAAGLFKLAWEECEPSKASNNVLLSVLRRVMPSLIAKDIIGVSPMTGPTMGIFNMRMRYKEAQEAQNAADLAAESGATSPSDPLSKPQPEDHKGDQVRTSE